MQNTLQKVEKSTKNQRRESWKKQKQITGKTGKTKKLKWKLLWKQLEKWSKQIHCFALYISEIIPVPVSLL